jgi:hypothetical protein
LGIFSDYVASYGTGSLKQLANIEFVAKIVDNWITSTFNTHTHTKSQITDFAHSHTKSEITDFSHTHTKANITDFSHTHTVSDITDLYNKIYPVGSIYISVNNTNPGTYLTGTTWAVWGSGRVLVGVDTGQTEFNTVEKTGGEKTHALTVNEMPSHNHGITDPGHSHSLNGNNYDRDGGGVTWTDTVDMNRNEGGVNTSTTGISIRNTGGNSSHNNIQPYITCYMFKRTS